MVNIVSMILTVTVLVKIKIVHAGEAQEQRLSCPESFHLTRDSSLILTQQMVDNETMAIELTYLGHAWLGFGFNRDGQMVGSTVVVGFPLGSRLGGDELEEDEVSNTTTANPNTREAQRYYLGSKQNLALIKPYDPDEKVYYIPPAPPDDDDDDDGGWRRQLELPDNRDSRRNLLAIQDSTISQNDTHTVLRFFRPIHANPEEGVKVSVHPDSLNTFIYAVGRSNTFGYHAIRGAHSILFDFESTCGVHGTLAPSWSHDFDDDNSTLVATSRGYNN